jgi:hypothetical protein
MDSGADRQANAGDVRRLKCAIDVIGHLAAG